MKYSRCTSTSIRKFLLVWDCKTCHNYSHPVKLAEQYFKLKFALRTFELDCKAQNKQIFFTYRLQRDPNPLGIFGNTMPLTQCSRNVNWYLLKQVPLVWMTWAFWRELEPPLLLIQIELCLAQSFSSGLVLYLLALVFFSNP